MKAFNHIYAAALTTDGQPAGTKGQSVGHGWVTLLDPLTKGTHTIEIENHKSPKITTTIVVKPGLKRD